MSNRELKLLKYAFAYIVIWCLSPPLAYGAIYRILALAACAFIVYRKFKLDDFRTDRSFVAIIFLIIYIMILAAATGDGITKRLGTFIMLFIMIVGEIFQCRNFPRNEFYFLIPLTLLLCIIWNLCTLKGIAEEPTIMRLLAKNSSISVSYARRGVGGFGYIYMIIILLPVGLDCALRKESDKKIRVLAAGFVVTSYILAFQSQYFMAMILAVMLVGVYFVIKIEKVTVRVVLLLVLFFTFIIVYANADKILIKLIEINTMRSVDLKLRSIYDMLLNDGSIQDSEFSVRFKRYMRDLQYIANHPLLGGFTYMVTGNHSYFLDFIAQYGIPIGIFYIKLSMDPLLRLNLWKFAAGFTSLIMFIIIGSLNTIAFSFGVILYIAIPLYFYMIGEGDNGENTAHTSLRNNRRSRRKSDKHRKKHSFGAFRDRTYLD